MLFQRPRSQPSTWSNTGRWSIDGHCWLLSSAECRLLDLL